MHSIKTNRCPVYIAGPQQLGIPSKNPLAMDDHTAYESLFLEGDMERYVRL